MAEAAPSPALTALPILFPLDFDEGGQGLRCIELSEDDYRAASFLDERMLEGRASLLIPRDEGERIAATLTGESDFIFHIGHVGSTLLSRLLGGGDRRFALREPAILRTLARRELRMIAAQEASFDRGLTMVLRLLARVWRPDQRSLVKATSFVAEIAGRILAESPSAKALLMFVPPQISIATRLAGPASRAELPRLAPAWLERLHRRLGGRFWRLAELSEGEVAALGWTCELCALAAAASRYPARTRWVEFDALLADPGAALTAIVTFLQGRTLAGEVGAMIASGELRRYAKAPEHAYGPGVRRHVIGQGLREHAAEIERGIAWINAAGTDHALVADAARLSATGVR